MADETLAPQQDDCTPATKASRKAYNRAWNLANKDRVRALEKARYHANKHKRGVSDRSHKTADERASEKAALDAQWTEATRATRAEHRRVRLAMIPPKPERVRKTVGPEEIAARAAAKKAYRHAWYSDHKEEYHQRYLANIEAMREYNRARNAADKDARKTYNGAYYAANRSAVLEQKRAYYDANRAKISEQNQKYRAANSEKLSAKARANQPKKNAQRAARYRDQPAFRIRLTITVGINQSLKSGKGGAKWETLVGYGLPDLTRHLGMQFTKGMTWENYGSWHVDHIQPLASFLITGTDCPEFRAAWALSNLRPLWAAENLSKNARRTLLL